MNKNCELAVSAVLKDTGISRKEVRKLDVEEQEKLCYVSFCTDWQEYEAYVDTDSLQVLGLNFMPLERLL